MAMMEFQYGLERADNARATLGLKLVFEPPTQERIGLCYVREVHENGLVDLTNRRMRTWPQAGQVPLQVDDEVQEVNGRKDHEGMQLSLHGDAQVQMICTRRAQPPPQPSPQPPPQPPPLPTPQPPSQAVAAPPAGGTAGGWGFQQPVAPMPASKPPLPPPVAAPPDGCGLQQSVRPMPVQPVQVQPAQPVQPVQQLAQPVQPVQQLDPWAQVVSAQPVQASGPSDGEDATTPPPSPLPAQPRARAGRGDQYVMPHWMVSTGVVSRTARTTPAPVADAWTAQAAPQAVPGPHIPAAPAAQAAPDSTATAGYGYAVPERAPEPGEGRVQPQPAPDEVLNGGGLFTVIADYDANEIRYDGVKEGGYLPLSRGEFVQVQQTSLQPGGPPYRYPYYVYGHVPQQPEDRKGWIPTHILAK